MKCSSCGKDNPDGSLFCKFCGNRLPVSNLQSTNSAQLKCQRCGTVNKQGSIYCGTCGSSLQSIKSNQGVKVKSSAGWWFLIIVPVIGAIIAQVKLRKIDRDKTHFIISANVLISIILYFIIIEHFG